VLAYEGPGRELVARLKYRNARSSVSWLADRMAAVARARGRDRDPACVAWVPTSTARRRERGFDQAELLARAVARRLGLPCRPLLRRGGGPPQTGRTLAERRRGPTFTTLRRRVEGSVLLVDDVITTGSTVAAAARALRAGGATEVLVVAAARTPYRACSSGDGLGRRGLGSGDPVLIQEGRE
jgi:ComF family protein